EAILETVGGNSMNTEQSGLDRRIPRGSPVGVSILGSILVDNFWIVFFVNK
ncbi:MAG: hypothetical protein RLZZ115_103, partial [Cyanobacteriota bacterium]